MVLMSVSFYKNNLKSIDVQERSRKRHEENIFFEDIDTQCWVTKKHVWISLKKIDLT